YIVAYRLQTESIIKKTESANFPTRYGHMKIHHYQSELDTLEWIAITAGDITNQLAPLVRLHSQCLTSDVFHSKRCDCGEQLEMSMQWIAKEGGILLYLPQEGRNIGLLNKIKSYALQDIGLDTVEANHRLGFKADEREYFIPAQILKDLGIQRVRLMTNNVNKVSELKKYDIEVVERIPLIVEPNQDNIFYLKTKQNKLGHELNL
ncbi:MAG: hypothetical protein ACD_29C00146G0002, partial [uncultured bacterium]